MIAALSRLIVAPRALLVAAPKALTSRSSARMVSTKMAASDDERWPDPDVYTTGRDEIDHLHQLRQKRVLQEMLATNMDEHLTLSYDEEELIRQVKEHEKMIHEKKNEEHVRRHAWEEIC